MVMPNYKDPYDPLNQKQKDPWSVPFNDRITQGFYDSNGAYSPNGTVYVPHYTTTAPFGDLGGMFGNSTARTVNSLYGVQTDLMAGSPLAGPPAPGVVPGVVMPEIQRFYPSGGGVPGPIQGWDVPLDPTFKPPKLDLGSKLGAGPIEAPRYQNPLGTGPSSAAATWQGPTQVGGRILGAPDSAEAQSQSPFPPAETAPPPEEKSTGWKQVWKNGKLKWVLIRNRNHQRTKNDEERARQKAAAAQGRSIEQAMNWRVASG